ncbi:MAG: adenylate/guanylate cyclase domain-containing protein [Candidatus Rokuibacteriota bacterium]
MVGPGKILIVDDDLGNREVLQDLLRIRGYSVVTAGSGPEALESVRKAPPDLVLLDVSMPGMSGYEVCERLREDPATHLLPIVIVTTLEGQEEKIRAIEAGADDFLNKPVSPPELVARVKSLLRIKELHDQLAEWSRTLEQRVEQQVEQLQRISRLKRYLAPQIADVIMQAGNERMLEGHRREISVVFCDLRGFTAFSETAEPEEVMGVLKEYHAAMGLLIFRFEGTVGHFAGDGMMIFFNDPFPRDDYVERAVRMSLEMREGMKDLKVRWRRRGFDLDEGIGISLGYATLGKIGFEGRLDYSAIGSVCNLAARLCGEAQGGQILIPHRVAALMEGIIETEPVGDLTLKGFHRSVAAFNVLGLKKRPKRSRSSNKSG